MIWSLIASLASVLLKWFLGTRATATVQRKTDKQQKSEADSVQVIQDAQVAIDKARADSAVRQSAADELGSAGKLQQQSDAAADAIAEANRTLR